MDDQMPTPSASGSNLSLILSIVSIVMVLVVGSVLYVVNSTALSNLEQEVRDNHMRALVKIDKLQGDLSDLELLQSGESKTWRGDWFSYEYPANLIADDDGLWTKEGINKHVNVPTDGDLIHTPLYAFWGEGTTKTLEQYILDDLYLDFETLDDYSVQTGLSHETDKIGNYTFTRVEVSEMMTTIAYYAMEGGGRDGGVVASFKVTPAENDSQELRDIMATLKFN